jgi:hypothetical protein
MDAAAELLKARTRRQLFRDCVAGVGSMALGSLLAGESRGADAAKTHHAAKAKSIIYLHMAGSPSPLEMFDPKPKLIELNGKPCPESYTKGQQFAFIKGQPKLLGCPHPYQKHGQSGAEISSILPHTAKVADELCIVRSMTTDQFNHAPAQLFLQTGSPRLGRPSMGSWLSYGLGSASKNLPAFVVLVTSPIAPDGGASLWGSGFLPTVHQGVQLRSRGEPVLFLDDPAGLPREGRRGQLDALNQMNRLHLEAVGDPETLTRIEQYELAYRMQESIPAVADLSKETAETLALYGAKPGERSFANGCLLARRLVESGVRFVQLYHWGWDVHGTAKDTDIRHGLVDRCRETDQPCAALITDLKRRGLLDSTIVVWGGEFGRTPMNEERNGSKWLGRDHHQHCFTMWLAGGGFKAGQTYGKTDELGYFVAENPVPVHDLQATLLHQMGFDHERLTYRFQGRDFRLTDVHGRVVKGLLS